MSEHAQSKGRWRITRRGFLIGAGATGGLLALGIGVGLPEARLRIAQAFDGAVAPGSFPEAPALWFEVLPDSRLRVMLPKVEMGQGIHTALAQIAAEELGIGMDELDVAQASTISGPPDSSGTQGSSSVVVLFEPLRRTAATLRALLRAEAARQLGVEAGALRQVQGAFERADDATQRRTFAELAGDPSGWEVPAEEVALTPASDFRLIGAAVPRVDIPAKVTGAAGYGFDARVEGMRFGAILRPPTLGARLRRLLNADEVRGMAGVEAVVEEEGFVGVVAASRPQAWAARDALKGEWAEERRWQQAELDDIVTVGGRGAVTIQREGNAPNALRGSGLIEAEYRTPFAAHAPMEPQAALADVGGDTLRIWTSTQMPARTAEAVAEALGVEAGQIELLPTFLGGGFGRKGIVEVAVEAARLSRAVGAPVHVGWTRVEEMRYGYFRPPTHHRLRGRLEGGSVAALQHQQASGDVLFAYFPAIAVTVLGADFGAYRGATVPYGGIANRHVEVWRRALPVPTGPWRGLGLLANVFAVESFVDELAHAAGADPLAFRLAHLGDSEKEQRLRAVLEAAAEGAGWATPAPPGRARGIAACLDAGTAVAEVAEVSLDEATGRPRVHRIVAAMDCGLVISPDGAAAQVEGNIMWGVGSTLIEAMRVEEGRVALGNFDSYPLLTMREAPDVTVLLIDSPIREPRGVGEPAIGPVAAAIANALFALTGERRRTLPLA